MKTLVTDTLERCPNGIFTANTPKWVMDAVRAAHDEEPDNLWRQNMAFDILEILEENGPIHGEDREEMARELADKNLSALLEWLYDNYSRIRYGVDVGTTLDSFGDLLRKAQVFCISRMIQSINHYFEHHYVEDKDEDNEM